MLCLLCNLFDEYNYAILKYYLKISIDQYMMWCFFVICCVVCCDMVCIIW